MPFALFDTPLGTCGLAWRDAGVAFVQLPEESREATRARLASRAGGEPEIALRAAPGWIKEAAARIREHLAGKPQDLSRVPLDLSAVTPFAAKVYRALQAVPAGKTTTYGDLARVVSGTEVPGTPRSPRSKGRRPEGRAEAAPTAIGNGARAVGRAMATNPVPLLVPCHRVVGANDAPGGFSAYGGAVTKEKLLVTEGGALTRQTFRRRRTDSPKGQRQTSLFDGTRRLPFDGDAALAHLSDGDPVLGRHIARVGPLRLQLKASEGTFAALAESIVYQQLSTKAAATIFGRFRALHPDGRLEPERVLAAGDEALRAAGLSRGKIASLRDLAARTASGEIPPLVELERMDDDAIVERLTRVRGIGRWTVEMLLIFRLGRPDVLPVADYGIKKGFARVFARTKRGGAELPSVEAMERRGERWRPFRSVASWYLWRACDTPS